MEYHNCVWDECQPVEAGWANVYRRGWCYYIGKIYQTRANPDRSIGAGKILYRINVKLKENN